MGRCLEYFVSFARCRAAVGNMGCRRPLATAYECAVAADARKSDQAKGRAAPALMRPEQEKWRSNAGGCDRSAQQTGVPGCALVSGKTQATPGDSREIRSESAVSITTIAGLGLCVATLDSVWASPWPSSAQVGRTKAHLDKCRRKSAVCLADVY